MLVKGLETKDFGYLINYITNFEIVDVDNNVEYIKENRNEILKNIDFELNKERLQEENLVSHAVAILNLKNLKKIIENI